MKQVKTSEKQYYDDYYIRNPRAYEYIPPLEKQLGKLFLKMIKTIQPKITDTVLSLGCAEGRFEVRFAPEVKKIIGMDVSDQAILKAKKNAQKTKIKNTEFCVFDVTKRLPFRDGSFNGVLALGIFHHIDIKKLNPLLKEINRVLKTDGFLYTMDPNAKGILRIIARTFFNKIYQSKAYRSPNEYDIDYTQLANLCLKSGLKVKKIEFLDSCFSEIANLWPKLPQVFFDFLLPFDRIWGNAPIIKRSSSQFSLFCRKSK